MFHKKALVTLALLLTLISATTPRDPASGMMAPRDVSTGLATGILSPRDPNSGGFGG